MRQLRVIAFTFIFLFLFACQGFGGTIVSEKLLRHAGLETVWQSPLALNEGESVQEIWPIEEHLYVLTSSNYVFCIEKDTGDLLFSFAAARTSLPVLKPTVYENKAYIIGGNDLIIVDLKSGSKLYRGRIDFPVSASPGANGSYLYIAGMDKRLRAMDLQGKSAVFKASADNVSGITSVLATESNVFFSTDAGNVICMSPDEPKRYWQFDAVGGITAPVVVKNGGLYASSRDTNIYKINASNGSKIWKFYAGSVLVDSPRVTKTTVYQFAERKGVYAIGADEGNLLWQLPTGVDLLAEDDGKAYVLDERGMCVVMDNKTGKKVSSLNFLNVTKSGANTADSRIFVMNGKNLIACIRPID